MAIHYLQTWTARAEGPAQSDTSPLTAILQGSSLPFFTGPSTLANVRSFAKSEVADAGADEGEAAG